MLISKEIGQGWSFTQISGGRGTKDGEWLEASAFPTTVHVELIRKNIIPDPVCVNQILDCAP
jgi:beta-mannosidase